MDILAAGFGLAAVVGLGQSLAGWEALRRFRSRPTPQPHSLPSITILKPLHGDEPLLEEALASCCQQDYPSFQIVFGLQDPADPAIAVLRRLRRRFPDVAMDVVIDRTTHGLNRKIGNLINMMPHARHDMLVIADSDMHVAPDYLRSLVGALQQPGVGLVTTLYAGRAASDTITGQLGAAQINHAFLPGALLARAMGREDCLGATMALMRDTLESVGGLRALSNHLADDAVLGRLVQARGLKVALARTVPATTVPEIHVPTLFEHELRWARTVKSLVPVEFALSAVPVPPVLGCFDGRCFRRAKLGLVAVCFHLVGARIGRLFDRSKFEGCICAHDLVFAVSRPVVRDGDPGQLSYEASCLAGPGHARDTAEPDTDELGARRGMRPIS